MESKHLPLLASEKRMRDSKKFLIALIGAANVMTVFIVSMIVFVTKPDVAQHVQSLATTTVGFFLAVISILITGQSAVEWSQSNAVESKVSEERRTVREERLEHVVIEDQPGAPVRRPFSPNLEHEHFHNN